MFVGVEQIEARPALLAECPEVYSTVMLDKPPTLAVLNERVGSAIKTIGFLGVVVVAAAVGVGVFLNIRGVEHGERLSKIEGKLEGIAKNLDRLLDRQAKNAFTVPGQSPEDIEAAVARLRVRNITVNFDDIHRASAVLVKNPDQRSCGVLMQLAAYRSVVNSTITEARQNIVQTIGPGDHGKWFQGKPGEWTLIVDQTLTLDAKDQYELPHLNDATGHPASVYQYIIFKNCHIIYHGGEVTLVKVFFDNCTFDIQHSDIGERFAESILSPAPFATFFAPG
jgi:DNA-binding FrmR family transcriptional regulator